MIASVWEKRIFTQFSWEASFEWYFCQTVVSVQQLYTAVNTPAVSWSSCQMKSRRWRCTDAFSAVFWKCRFFFFLVISRAAAHTLYANCPVRRQHVKVFTTSRSQRVNTQENISLASYSQGTATKPDNTGQLVYSITTLTVNEDHMTHYIESICNSRLYFLFYFFTFKNLVAWRSGLYR